MTPTLKDVAQTLKRDFNLVDYDDFGNLFEVIDSQSFWFALPGAIISVRLSLRPLTL